MIARYVSIEAIIVVEGAFHRMAPSGLCQGRR